MKAVILVSNGVVYFVLPVKTIDEACFDVMKVVANFVDTSQVLLFLCSEQLQELCLDIVEIVIPFVEYLFSSFCGNFHCFH